jgi:hypothetical protein
MHLKLVMKDVTSVRVVDERLYVAVSSDREGCRIVELRDDGIKHIVYFSDTLCNILLGLRDSLLVSAGNTSYIVSNDGVKPVLRAEHGNWFWHAVEACGKVFVQEHGGFLW